MIKITVKELENNIDKYIALGKKEQIVVVDGERELFTIYPNNGLKKRWESIFGSLPPEASNDNDIDRE